MRKEQSPKKAKRVATPPNPTPSERLEVAGRATISAAITTLMGDPAGIIFTGALGFLAPLFPTLFAKRAEAWCKELQLSANTIRDHGIDIEELRDNEEFADIVMKATEVALRTRSDAKRALLRNAVTTTGIEGMVSTQPGAAEQARRRLFVNFVDELDEHHVGILRFARAPAAFLQSIGQHLPQQNIGRIAYECQAEAIKLALKGFGNHEDPLDRDLLELALQELSTRRLIDFQPEVECHTTPMAS